MTSKIIFNRVRDKAWNNLDTFVYHDMDMDKESNEKWKSLDDYKLAVARLYTKFKLNYNVALSMDSIITGMNSIASLKSLDQQLSKYLSDCYQITSGKVFYKGFPEEVQNLSDAELIINAILHYSGFTNTPAIEPEDQDDKTIEDIELPEDVYDGLTSKPIKTIKHLETYSEASPKVFNLIYNSPIALSEDDLSLMNDILGEMYQEDVNKFTDFVSGLKVPTLRTNYPVVAAMIVKKAGHHLSKLTSKADTYTDLLRVINQLSVGTSYLDDFNFNLKTSQKKYILRSFEATNGSPEDLVRYSEQWKLVDRLCQFSKEKYPKFYRLMNRLYYGGINTFNSKMEKAIKKFRETGNDSDLIKLGKQRPSDFARNYMRAYHDCIGVNSISIKDILNKVPLRVLIQLANRMIQLTNGNVLDSRPVSYNGSTYWVNENKNYLGTSNGITKSNVLPVLSVLKSRVLNNYNTDEMKEWLLSQVGKNDFDKPIKFKFDRLYSHIALPTSLRESNSHFTFIPALSNIDLGDKNNLRLLTYWENTESERIDTDLAVNFYDDKFSKYENISYYKLRNKFATHSGDIVDAPDGAVEAVDIDREKALESGFRYAEVDLFAYTRESFRDVGTVSFGYYSYQNNNNHHRPSLKAKNNLKDIFGVNAPSRTAFVALVDLKTNVLKVIDKDKSYRMARSYDSDSGVNSETEQEYVDNFAKYYANYKASGISELISVIEGNEYVITKNDDKVTLEEHKIVKDDKTNLEVVNIPYNSENVISLLNNILEEK